MSSKKEDEKELRTWLETDFFKLLDDIKGYFGIKNTTEIIRFLIKEKHREIFGGMIQKKKKKKRNYNFRLIESNFSSYLFIKLSISSKINCLID